MSDDLTTIGHGLFAGYLPNGNLAIDCYHVDRVNPPPMGARVVVQRADIPDLLTVIASKTVAPMAIVNRPPTPSPDPRREAFWSAAYCAAYTRGVSETDAGLRADGALIEWDRRWGAK